MTELNEGRYPGEFILSEMPGAISRDAVTVDVPAATTLAPGTVLGQIAATGHYAPYDEANSDGTETAAGVLYGECANDDETAAEMAGVILDFGAEVRNEDLVWGDGVDEAGGLTDLAALFIKARD
jgi:hypothetical protein